MSAVGLQSGIRGVEIIVNTITHASNGLKQKRHQKKNFCRALLNSQYAGSSNTYHICG